jgi:hypothetical protein
VGRDRVHVSPVFSSVRRSPRNGHEPRVRVARETQMHPMMHMCPRSLSRLRGSHYRRVREGARLAFEAAVELVFELDQAADGPKLDASISDDVRPMAT